MTVIRVVVRLSGGSSYSMLTCWYEKGEVIRISDDMNFPLINDPSSASPERLVLAR